MSEADKKQHKKQAVHQSKTAGTANVFTCKVCNVHCTSEMNLKMHLIGMKHKKTKEALNDVKPSGSKAETKNKGAKASSVDAKSAPTSSIEYKYGSSYLEERLKEMGSLVPLIGLNHVIEYQSEGAPDPLFFCRLCGYRGGFSSFLSHLFGYKHRLKYISKEYPEALQLEGAKLKHSEMNALVKEKAALIEKLDGRGKVKIVLDELKHVRKPPLKRSKDECGPSDPYFSQHSNFENSFDQRGNARGSSSYEKRISWSQDFRSFDETLQNDWGKSSRSEGNFHMDWHCDDKRDSRDDYRREEQVRNRQDAYSKGSDIDDRWMQNEFEPYQSESSSRSAYLNQELFEYLQHFQIMNDRDASFALKVTQSLTDGLMEYRLKTITGLTQDKRPLLDEVPDKYESYMFGEAPPGSLSKSSPSCNVPFCGPGPRPSQRANVLLSGLRPRHSQGSDVRLSGPPPRDFDRPDVYFSGQPPRGPQELPRGW
uniref:Uncharacterized LOC103186336 n=1 Tax=Callorhinchus milii TaxID=7868 RepID=V9KU90_CALMI|eukprot:gi/632974091/ref/XP_007903483.1/ PREDICTED: uncharacterized protein LOC103186336 isoform X1 [Callorhinchus milii]